MDSGDKIMPTTSLISGNRTYPTSENFGEYLFYSDANLQSMQR